MFKDIPGAEFDEDNSIYVVPCDTAVNVSLTIGYVIFSLTFRGSRY